MAYADDVTLVCSGNLNDAMLRMQSLLDTVYAWSVAHRLKLNISKCFAMLVPKSARSVPIDRSLLFLYIDGNPISWSEELKILGVTFNSALNWSAHSYNVRTKISRMVGMLQRFGCTLDGLTRKRIFQAFILPHVIFCLPIWGTVELTQQRQIDICLLRSAKLIQRDHKLTFSLETYNSTGILPFRSFVLLRNAIAVFNFLHKDVVNLYLHVDLLCDSSMYSTRQVEGRKFRTNKITRKCDQLQFARNAVSD